MEKERNWSDFMLIDFHLNAFYRALHYSYNRLYIEQRTIYFLKKIFIYQRTLSSSSPVLKLDDISHAFF